MKKLMVVLFLCMIILINFISPEITLAEPDIYATGYEAVTSPFNSIDSSNGSMISLGQFTETCCVTGLSWRGSSLYGIKKWAGVWSLIEIDPELISYSIITGWSQEHIESLAYDGTYFYLSSWERIYENTTFIYYYYFWVINPDDGSVISRIETDYTAYGMEFYDGILYGGDRSGNFFSINRTTGTKTLIGTGTNPIDALTVVDDVMYGAYWNAFFSIDMLTGQQNIISNAYVNIAAMAPITPPVTGDIDQDGYTESEGDCDDEDPAINPGVVEVCDSIDNNCDGEVDEGDFDVDGIDDCIDDCPEEDSTGFDADANGCIDTLSDLISLLEMLVNEEVIAEELQNSLMSKIENATKSADKENICAATNQLEALMNQVNAQRGNKISDEAADDIIAYTESVILYLQSQLPEGDSC